MCLRRASDSKVLFISAFLFLPIYGKSLNINYNKTDLLYKNKNEYNLYIHGIPAEYLQLYIMNIPNISVEIMSTYYLL